MLSGNCQTGPLFGVVDAGLASTTNMSKTKIVVFYSLSNAFDITSGSTFRANIDPNILKGTWATPVYQLANPYCLYTHNA